MRAASAVRIGPILHNQAQQRRSLARARNSPSSGWQFPATGTLVQNHRRGNGSVTISTCPSGTVFVIQIASARPSHKHLAHFRTPLTMGSSVPDHPSESAANSAHDAPPFPPAPRRSRSGKRRRRGRPGLRYGLILGALFAVVVATQFVVHSARTDPRDTHTIAERELQLNTLQPGERVIRSVSVFKRPAINYFRATRGLLVLTNRRLLYLGLEPRDLLAAPDLPPTFEERDFALDTLVHVSAGRTFFGLARAIVIETPNETLRLGVPTDVWPSADVMIVAMDARRDRAVALGAVQRAFLAKAEAERKAAEAARRKPKFYTVKRGDALANIAIIWNTSPEKLREWNRLTDNRIRVGQVLMVRPAL
jgi:LysM domain